MPHRLDVFQAANGALKHRNSASQAIYNRGMQAGELARALDATVELEFDPDGLHCHIVIPANQILALR